MARRAGRRTDYTWQGSHGVLSLAATGSGIVTINTPSSSSTVTRSRGEVLAQIDGPVDNDQADVTCGLIVVTPEQLAAGATSIPDPFTDMDAEWIWHGFLLVQANAGTGVGASLNALSVVARLTIDSKAMRRIKQNQSVVFVVKNTNLGGTPTVDVFVGCRQLFGV